jgi:MFS family permease
MSMQRRPFDIPGLLIYGALLGGVTLATHPVVLGLWSLAIGAAAGVVAPLPTALIGDRVPPPFQSVAIGWLRTVSDSGMVVGPLVMGALADAVHLAAPFLLAAALLGLLVWRCRRQAVEP